MTRQEKEAFIAGFRQQLEKQTLVIVVHQVGMTVEETQVLRRQARAQGGQFKVVKNTLMRRCVQNTAYEDLMEFLAGPTALIFSEDPIAAAKIIVSFAKENKKISVLGGALNGEKLTKERVKHLAGLPSLDVLRAQLLGVLLAPAGQFVRVLQAPQEKLARLMAAHMEKKSSE